MEIYEKAVDKMVKLEYTTSSKLKQPERMKKALDVIQTEGSLGLEFTRFTREKVNRFIDLPFTYMRQRYHRIH